MYYRLKDNQLLIFYGNGKLKENATENQNECKHCIYIPKNCECKSKSRLYGGQFCETMKCKYEEKEN